MTRRSATTLAMRLVPGLVVAFALSVPATAFAQNEALGRPRRSFESPQNFAFEFRVARYLPNIDSEPALSNAGKTPFQSVYGTTPRFLVGGELDWQAVRIPHFGTLGPALSFNYTTIGAPANYKNTQVQSPEATTLEVIPMYAVAVLRVDAISRDLHVPLVPFAKAGIEYALWRSYTDTGLSRFPGDVPGATTVPAHGGTFGYHIALGLALDLNVFDQQTARNFDDSMGVNHTYLFVEAVSMNLTGLWEKNPLILSSTNVAAGLTFEF